MTLFILDSFSIHKYYYNINNKDKATQRIYEHTMNIFSVVQ